MCEQCTDFYEKEISRMERKYDDLLDQNDGLKAEVVNLQNQIDHLEMDKSFFRDENQSLRNEIKALERQYK